MIDGTVMNRTLPLFLLLIVGFYISWNIFYPFKLKMRLIERITDGREIDSHLMQLQYEIFGTVDILIHPRRKRQKKLLFISQRKYNNKMH